MSASTYYNSLCHDSGFKIDLDKEFHNGLFEPPAYAIAGDDVSHSASIDNVHNNNINPLKRAHLDANVHRTEPSEKPVKKSRASSIEKPRVLCPFYKRDPIKHAQRVSCYHTGFEEMSRLKQHLIHVHGIKKESLDFKNRRFSSLGTIEEKCSLLYRDLFPQDDTASPYEEAVIPGSPTTANVSDALLRVKLETIMAQHGIDPELAARVSTIFQGASEAMKCNTNKLKDNYGLLTPPTSAESSPEMSQLDAFTTPTFEPLPGVPVTRGVLDNNFIDPLLYPTHDMDSMPLFDSGIGTECAWESCNAAPAMVQPVNISDAAFAGTSNILPSLDVCSDCLSTNIIYGFPMAPVDEPQPLSGNLDVIQDVNKFPSTTEELSSVDPFMGADAFTDEAGSILTLGPEFNWDEWIISEDRCDDIWTESRVSAEYSAIDKLFEF